MAYTYIDPEFQKKFDTLRTRIRRLQSGKTLDSILKIGADVSNQIGASFVSLKSLVSSYDKDERLATALWQCKHREEQIVACFLFPDNLNKEKITQLISSCLNYEVAEYFGSVLLSRQSILTSIIEEWSHSSSPMLQIATLTATARELIVNKGNSVIPDEVRKYLISHTYDDLYVQMVSERYYFNFK